MSGKCRPHLRKKTLENVKRSALSQTDKNCIEAVFERFKPKKPIISVFNVLCPQCNHDLGKERAKREAISNFKYFCYCSACGQALDWSDVI